jgi:hypothetical protein
LPVRRHGDEADYDDNEPERRARLWRGMVFALLIEIVAGFVIVFIIVLVLR